jgi:CRISPR-associated protein Csd2
MKPQILRETFVPNPSVPEDADVALHPGPNADAEGDVVRAISAAVRERYDVFSYRHAASLLASNFASELREIEQALLSFELSTREIGMPGGNESGIPKKFSHYLRPLDWVETRIQGDLLVRLQQSGQTALVQTIENFIDGHKIDYVKGRVAFDLEWNSKDQTFDRDLYALRTFHECGLISAGILVTRSASLNPVFERVTQLDKAGQPELDKTGKRAGQIKTVRAKYGASTTWMGKLLYRLNAGRHGGCPVLVFGITPKCITDWSDAA